ncbi:MAG: hypothetical protein FJ297_09625 [Planctomycetes bacterium]|nr:hypothetical protein [Planctomycetota bacterium]
MRLTSRRRQGAKIELAMTSMIDVVFLLLIFFMTTSFGSSERWLDPAVRVERSGANAAQRDLQPAIVEIVRSGESHVYRLGASNLASVAELTARLRQFPNKSDGAFVRVVDGAPFGMAAAAVQACAAARFMPVSYVPWDEGTP